MLSPLLEKPPQPPSRRIALHITPNAERILRQGHPWLFADSITRQSHEGNAGDLSVIFDKKDRFMAIGLYDPESPVRVKILHQGSAVRIDADWFTARIAEAVKKRAPLIAAGTTGYRVIHGENDGLSGMIVDRYADTCVVKLYTRAWLPYLRLIVPELARQTGVMRIILRLSRMVQAGPLYGLSDGAILYGDAPPVPLIFTENGLNFAVDVVNGHKTGFFCDQRDNRARVRALAQGRRVLDIFSYVGAFSLSAAAGGAKEVTSVDVSAPALEAARQNFALNQHILQVKAAHLETIAEDAFAVMERLRQQGRQYEMVIVDPPTFATSAAQIPRALDAYQKLVRLALPLVTPNGIFVMASCSSRIEAPVFFEMVIDTAHRSGYLLEEIERTGHALDHPITFPEGSYLKCLFARVLD
jgi:23S rRNA (cytosine1962-C5)-methyltransferase